MSANRSITRILEAMIERDRRQTHTTLPFVTPQLWVKLRCRCGICDVCCWFASVDADASQRAWLVDAPTETPAQRRERPRWSSVAAALEDLADAREDGARAAGQWGAVLDAARDGVLGASARAGRPPGAYREAEDLSLVDRALRQSAGCECVTGLTGHWADVVVEAVAGRRQLVKDRRTKRAKHRRRVRVEPPTAAEDRGLDTGSAEGVVRRSRRRIRVELAARGLVALSRPSTSLLVDVQRRREELGG